MEIIFVLIPLSFIFLGIAVYAFFWAVNNDQFSDLEGPAHSILFDEKQSGSSQEDTLDKIEKP